jgi:hypothetical protein
MTEIRAAASFPTTLCGAGGGSDATRRQVSHTAAGFAPTLELSLDLPD